MTPILWSILLILGGMLIIAAELFIPSGGLLSIFAAISLIAAIVVAFMDSLTTGALALSAVVVLVPLLATFLLRWWPQTRMGRRILLQSANERPDPQDDPRLQLLGRQGIVRNEMLPNGRIMIDDQLYDAVSQGMIIAQDTTIVVSAVDGNRIEVRPLRDDDVDTTDEVDSDPTDETPFEDPFAS